MQAALYVRNKRSKKKGDQRPENLASLPPHVATKPIRPFPRYNPLKLPNGKNAWGRKGGGEKPKATEAHKKWVNVNKNKIGDAGGDGTLEKSPDGKYRQTGVVNIVLYVGFGLIALGMILTFVGMGEHGFKSPELKLIGPSLIGCGFLFCLLRLFFCSVPACCKMFQKNKELDEKALLSPSRETLAEDTANHQNNVPQPLQEEKEVEQDRQALSKSAHTIRSTIPNYIEDEYEDDEALGLNVEYIDETSMRHRSRGSHEGSRPNSSQSKASTASNVPRLPDIHSNGKGNTGSELVLNPATLQSSGD